MPKRRPITPRSPPNPSALQSRVALFTYAFSRLPQRTLALLGLYAWAIVQVTERGWVSRDVLGKGGAAIVGALSMVTGLLTSYRFSRAVSQWDQGKQVWVEVRTNIRDGMRMLSIPNGAPINSPSISSPIELEEEATPLKPKAEKRDINSQRIDELSGLLVGFAFALQHHLHGSRPLPQPPLCDLLPPSYLSSLKRTEARVRFAESHAGPSGSSPSPDPFIDRPGLRRRSTGPTPTKEEQDSINTDDEWELSTLRDKAEEAVERLAEAVSGSGSVVDMELRQQLSQLNLPREREKEKEGMMRPRSKSNLHNPYPSNLPLALLKLMEGYIIGLNEVGMEKGGWPEAKGEKMLAVVKDLSASLGDAERLRSNPPPLPLTLHLSHLLLIYLASLPCSLLCVVSGYSIVIITLIAGWCFLGLEALVGEVGGVFGISENHLPLPRLTEEILLESLDISPDFMKYYRSRLVARLGEDEEEVLELYRRGRRGEEWLTSFG